MHETTTVAEVRRIFGTLFDGEIAGSLPGMEIGPQHKYAFSVLADFKPEEKAMRPEGEKLYRKHVAESDPSKVCEEPFGIPPAGLLSEPIKIDALRLTERFHRRDFGHLETETTFDAPKIYTRPFTIKVPFELMADQAILEMFCNQNEKDRAHLVK